MAEKPTPETTSCSRCEKPEFLCVCKEIKPVPSPFRVLILQHPQEPDKLLGSANLLKLSIEGAMLKVGLSWPNLAKAMGSPTPIDNARWGVLFLGSKGAAKPPAGRRVWVVNKNGEYTAPETSTLDGIIVLDGTWAQAKTMWWRNPWLLKLKRLVLVPSFPSLYGQLRKEPRRECLSTLEATVETLEGLGADGMGIVRVNFRRFLEHYRTVTANKPNA